jgi:hypothetical protein
LGEQEPDQVQVGNSISIVTKMPDYQGPKPHAPGSIAHSEINSDSTDDNLPDSGGGVIV